MSGDEAEWQRGIDFRPCPLGDRGRLEQHGELTIEHGIEAAYIEYWQREPHTASGASGSALFRSENDGRIAILVRQGNRFGYARDRQCPLGRHEELTELLRDASPESARNLVDCEVSMGTVTAQGWRIERSTLPWRQGARLIDSNTHIGEDRLIVRDADAEGAPLPRALRLLESYGSLDDDAMASPAAPPRTGLAQPVPVIDIAALGGGDGDAQAAVVGELGRAASQAGFFHVTGHGIAPDVIARMQAAAARFFAQPLERKMACYIGASANHRGYVPEGEEALGEGKRDRKEAFDLALDLPADSVPAGHPMLGPNRWPDLPALPRGCHGLLCRRLRGRPPLAARLRAGRGTARGIASIASSPGRPASCG